MRLLLISLEYSLPALQAHLRDDGEPPLGVADLLERCVRTGELLVTFAVCVGGRPHRS